MPSLKKHTCGYHVISVIPRSVTRQSLIAWYDGEQGSPTFRKEIRRCPGCGQKLTLAAMTGGVLPPAVRH